VRQKSGKALIYKGFEDNERNEREKRNVTFALHLLYVWARFERCLKGIALHRGGECYVFGCPDGCVGHFVGFWARMAAHVGALSSGHGNWRWWGLKRLVWVVIE
jgi:hypothetical protein